MFSDQVGTETGLNFLSVLPKQIQIELESPKAENIC
jgi:hypothetical protein